MVQQACNCANDEGTTAKSIEPDLVLLIQLAATTVDLADLVTVSLSGRTCDSSLDKIQSICSAESFDIPCVLVPSNILGCVKTLPFFDARPDSVEVGLVATKSGAVFGTPSTIHAYDKSFRQLRFARSHA